MHTIVRTAFYGYGALSTAAPVRPQAACVGEDPELFFPIGDTGPALLQIEEAKAVCRRCPLIESCLQDALDRNETSGVWGGLSETERRKLKRRAARQQAQDTA
ncbi:WhiB family transcriptional regulator [Streptomyces sp. NPDC091290]|uniref:WhiB family transcriptional regulator n=1 Tax=Streptomyces sp. NPDC091290 TaxID=3365990 RepID=UPI0037F5930C